MQGQVQERMAAVALMAMLVAGPLCAETTYETFQQAWSAGLASYNARDYKASQAPFEAALKLAPDDKTRLRVYEGLLASYRQLPGEDKFFAAADYILRHHTSTARKSLVRRSLLSFAFNRGQVDALAARYEKQLKKDQNDVTALYVLSELYSRVKRDPARAAMLTERLAKATKQDDQPVNVLQSANLARQFVRAKDFAKGAALYEKIAPADAKLAAWHYKEAAAAWLKAGDKAKALAAARKSHAAEGEKRNELLTHFWHKGLADALLEAGDAKLAITHYEQALATTKNDGYVKACRAGLEKARAALQ